MSRVFEVSFGFPTVIFTTLLLISVGYWLLTTLLGGGGGDIMRRDTNELVHFEDKGAGLIGLGYEFQLGRKFALGVAVDGIGIDLDGASGLEEDLAGMGSFSIQFNWYL